LTNTTIEAWTVWTMANPAASTAEWQRVFDFGSNSSTIEGEQGSNANAFFLTAKAGTNGKLHVEYESSGNINLEAPEALPTQVLVQLVVVVDEDTQILSMYQNGALQGARSFSGSLTTITYRNNWLGRSQYADNPSFQGRILDFRIYSAALAAPHIQASLAAGPDADW
jgi:Concanavalin A-like lectin/glucanases superfamily